MHEWYSQLTINIKWRGCYSKDVDVNIGTRQGGLSSLLLFNIFYQDLLDRLSFQHCGISISNKSYNVFCHADDLILTSLTVTGLQSLIDVSRDYIIQLGPRYEGQLNPMAEPIPHEVRPLVRTHVYHPYHAADRQAETDS